MSLAVLITTFVGCLALGFPVAVTLGLASFAYLAFEGMPLAVMPQKMYAGIDVFVLLCIPGFILAGNLMNGGGITRRIIRFANAAVGWVRGGLGLTNVAGSMLFGGISGTAIADSASIGGMMIPGMKRAGYPADFSAAVTAASSTVGPIIPPSVPMIIGTLGGMMGPTVEEAAVTAAEKSAGYPARFIPGIIMPPIEAESAIAVPEMPPKSIDPATLVSPSPPRTQPTAAFAKRMIRRVIPPPFMRLPARMNPGMHSSTKTSMPAYIFCGITASGMPSKAR